ncbi:unnamed protein product [Mortierella alpina]
MRMVQHDADAVTGPYRCNSFTYELKVRDPSLKYEYVLEQTDRHCQESHGQEDDEEAEEDAAYESDNRTEDYDGEDEEEFDDNDDEEGAANDDPAMLQYTSQQGYVPFKRPPSSSCLACSIPMSPMAMTRRRMNLWSASYTPKGQQEDESDADSTAMESGMAGQTDSVDTPNTTDSGCEDPSTLVTRSKAVTKTLRGKRCVRMIDSSDTETEQTAAPKTKSAALFPGSLEVPTADACSPCSHASLPVSARARNRLPCVNEFLPEEDPGAPLFVRRKRMLEMIHMAQIPLAKIVEVARSTTPGIKQRRSEQKGVQHRDDDTSAAGTDPHCCRQSPGVTSTAIAPVHSVILPCDICLCEFVITGQETVVDFARHKVQCARQLESRQRFLRMRGRLERRIAGLRDDTSSDESTSDSDFLVETKTIKRY